MLDKMRSVSAPTAPSLLPSRQQAIVLPPTSRPRSLKEKLSRGSVGMSEDLKRILALPRRSVPNLEDIAEALTQALKTPAGTQKLRPIQAWALYEAPQIGGLFGSIAVGAGKSLMGLLMPMVMPGCRRAVLFVPASLRAQLLEHDWQFYGQHWQLPNIAGGSRFIPGRPVLHVVAYSELSSPKSTRLLEQINPDLIVGDEIHSLRHPRTARSIRALRFFAANPNTRFCGWSGTVTSTSIQDYAHISALALGSGSPLPVSPSTVEEWSNALDPNSVWMPGELTKLCKKGETAREGFRRRFVETPGVVATAENALGTSLVFYERKAPPMPEELKSTLALLRRSPEELAIKLRLREDLVDPMRMAACARELAAGFYYYWAFPKGEPVEVIDDWFRKRQDWNRELREKLKSPRPHLDSPFLCTKAAIRFYQAGCAGCNRQEREPHAEGCKEFETHPLWASRTWLAWVEVTKAVYHESRAAWLSDYLLRDASAWMHEKPGIVWVEHATVGHKLAELTGFPYYGGGEKASSEIIKEDGARSIIASVDAHGQGKNLQRFNRNLVVSFPGSAATVEQMIGRTHRTGQQADEVEVFYYAHTLELAEALVKAKEKAKYIEQTTGSAQKICYGTWAKSP